jgi:hypothetical protein
MLIFYFSRNFDIIYELKSFIHDEKFKKKTLFKHFIVLDLLT